ncbi:MAG: DNA polymerase I [Thermoanaerobaculia bacterium]|nr:DNA polymerase I [Thermoanaerobaculia bacterium]MBP9824459.1 DNA polymerase I [Thermoanaerobaculia bacterium]
MDSETPAPVAGPVPAAPDAARRPKLVLIDGFHNIFRAFFAIRNLSNSKGLPTNAVFGFVQILRKVLKDEAPDFIGVALDISDKTVRTEKFADYKANRAPMPDDLVPQIPYVRKAIEAFRIPRLELDNYEADDVMGTLAKKAVAEGYEVVLVSADKDLMQLVGPHVTLLHTGRNKRYDAAAVTEDFGVPPEQVADVLALMGDAVDNVPGVPGIGEKGARQLVAEYGSVEALLARASEVPRKAYREGLLAYREQAILSKELVTIHTDLPIEIHPESLQLDPPDAALLRELYTELEFFTLLAELDAASASGSLLPASGGGDVPAIPAVLSVEQWAEFAAAVGENVTIALADAGVPVAPVALAVASSSGDRRGWVDLRSPDLGAAVVVTLSEWFTDPAREIIGCDLKELLRLAPAAGEVCVARLFDLMLASYLCKASVHGHSLDEIALERTGSKLRSAKEAGFDKGVEPALGDERVGAWVAERLAAVERFAPLLRQELGTGALLDLYRRIESPLLPVLVGMEEAGIRLDVEFLRRMSAELGEEITGLEAEIYRLAGERFNIQSPQQLGTILFEKLKLPAGKKTKKTKSYSTGAETLEELAAAGHELPQYLLRYRELSKLKSTYVDALPQLLAADGRIHTRFQQAVAATGRLSSVNPNLQNIPIRTELGMKIRKAFCAAPGSLLVAADYSQIELRVLAHIAGERAMIEAFRSGEDIHRSTAATVLGISVDFVNAEQRRAAKTINFGLIYGMSAYGLAQALGIPTREAEQFIAVYFARYAGVEGYMQETLAAAERDGRVETLYGRVRYLPDIQSRNWNLKENARRMAINARIQGTAADLMKLAMIAVDRRLRAEHRQARLLLSVHDELVVEAPADEAPAVAELVRSEMAGVAELAVPLVVDSGIGPTWFDAKG